MALVFVLQHAGHEMCEECQALMGYECPDQWYHEETGYCSDCDAIVDIREEHHENCAMRALGRLALTCTEFSREAVCEKLLIYLDISGPEMISPQVSNVIPLFHEFFIIIPQ